MSQVFDFSGVEPASMGGVATPGKIDKTRAFAMRERGASVADIAAALDVSDKAVYRLFANRRRSGDANLTTAERVKALRPWDFTPHGTGPGATHTWKQIAAAASHNLDPAALSDRQKAGMQSFVRGLRTGGEVVVFTGKPPRFFDRKPRTDADGDLMIRTDGTLSDEQRAAFRMPDPPEDD